FGQNLLNAENLQGLRHVEDLGDRGRFLKAPSPKRLRQSGDLFVNGTLTAPLHGENLTLSINGRVVEPKIEASAPQGVSDSSLLVGSQYDKRYGSSGNSSKLWDTELPNTQNLEEQRLELLIHLIDLIDKEHAGFLFLQESPKKGTL